jgi:hypothetical protein
MAVRTSTRRRQRRFALGSASAARVGFEYPSRNGRRYDLPLVNISKSGLSFALAGHDDLAGLDPGTIIPQAAVRIGECSIAGELVLMHLTPDPFSRATCGALFYPASDEDLIKLRSLIAGMEALATD